MNSNAFMMRMTAVAEAATTDPAVTGNNGNNNNDLHGEESSSSSSLLLRRERRRLYSSNRVVFVVTTITMMIVVVSLLMLMLMLCFDSTTTYQKDQSWLTTLFASSSSTTTTSSSSLSKNIVDLVEDIPITTFLRRRFLMDDESTSVTSSTLSTTSQQPSSSYIPPSLFPFQSSDYIGFGLAIVSLLMAAGAGVGGGGILVPIYILVMDFPVKVAIPLASATVLGGAISNNLLNWHKKNPTQPHRPLIDWDLLLMLEPSTIAGALVGVVLNTTLPDAVILVSMVLLLIFTASATLDKANSLYRKETDAMKKAVATTTTKGEMNGNEGQPLLSEPQNGNIKNNGSVTPCEVTTTGAADGETVSSDEMSSIRKQVRSDVIKLILLFLVVTVMNLMTQGGIADGDKPAGTSSFLPTCDTTCYWVSQGTILLVIGAFFVYVRRALLNRVGPNGTGPILSDIEWNTTNATTYPCYAIIAGLVAGLFGIGGGIINGPLMLALGTTPPFVFFVCVYYNHPTSCPDDPWLYTILCLSTFVCIFIPHDCNNILHRCPPRRG